MIRYLFLHPNFPGQFLHVARHLIKAGESVTGVGEHHNLQRQSGMVPGARLLGYKIGRQASKTTHHYIRGTEDNVIRAQATQRLCLALKREGYRPDIIAAHTGWGDTLFLREVFPEARIAGYFEFYYRGQGADIGFDPEFPMSLDNRLEVKMKNATSLLAWEDCDAVWTPTRWQASLFPTELRHRLQIQHEGVDTTQVKPDSSAKTILPGGTEVHAGEEILTFVNRNMEPYRGFHIFMRALPEILSRRPKARVLITGMENDTSYGNTLPGGESWKSRLLRETGEAIDMSRVHFLGKLPYEAHIRVLQLSRAHIYLTYPYFVSWSMLEAMACGCLLIGSNTQPVTEFIEDGKNGLLVDFFDIKGLADRACEALSKPKKFLDQRENARRLIVESYDLQTKCVPNLLRLISGK
jgi:glycosyltransferase involved in cell wall biosynthesis